MTDRVYESMIAINPKSSSTYYLHHTGLTPESLNSSRTASVNSGSWMRYRLPRRKPSPSCPKTQTNSRLARRAVSIVIDPWRALDLGRVGGDVGDSGSPYAQGKHRPATGCHAPGRRPGSRPVPHLDQNVLAGYAAVALALILGLSGGLFSDAARPCQRPAPPLGANVALENRD